ncbi:MAG: DUF308 domain-containing protein [Clostridia bacterium]|nr:DUF308 domain-containing protein [Clostridia bacterium]
MKNLSVEQIKKLTIAILILILGILLCCSLAMGISGLSVIIGIILLVIGALFLTNSILNKNNGLANPGLGGIAIIAIGMMFIVNKVAGVVFLFIPWFLFILGLVAIADAFLGKFTREENNIHFVIKLTIGIISFILGLLLMVINGFADYASIILGLLLIVYSGYLMYTTFRASAKQV